MPRYRIVWTNDPHSPMDTVVLETFHAYPCLDSGSWAEVDSDSIPGVEREEDYAAMEDELLSNNGLSRRALESITYDL